MAAEIVGLHGVAVPDRNGEPCDEVVKVIEGLLRDAKSGLVRGFAYGSVTKDGMIKLNWHCGDDVSATMMAGLLGRLNHDYLAGCLKAIEEVS